MKTTQNAQHYHSYLLQKITFLIVTSFHDISCGVLYYSRSCFVEKVSDFLRRENLRKHEQNILGHRCHPSKERIHLNVNIDHKRYTKKTEKQLTSLWACTSPLSKHKQRLTINIEKGKRREKRLNTIHVGLGGLN